jgi:hypothetical protein
LARKAVKKRGRKPGVKVGPYKKTKLADIQSDDINKLVTELSNKIKQRIKNLQTLLKRIK